MSQFITDTILGKELKSMFLIGFLNSSPVVTLKIQIAKRLGVEKRHVGI